MIYVAVARKNKASQRADLIIALSDVTEYSDKPLIAGRQTGACPKGTDSRQGNG